MLSLLFLDGHAARLVSGGVKNSGIGRYCYNLISRLSNFNVLTLKCFVHLSVGGFSLEDSHWLGWRLSCATGLATCSMMHGEVGRDLDRGRHFLLAQMADFLSLTSCCLSSSYSCSLYGSLIPDLSRSMVA
jgi:hypothetical protein